MHVIRTCTRTAQNLGMHACYVCTALDFDVLYAYLAVCTPQNLGVHARHVCTSLDFDIIYACSSVCVYVCVRACVCNYRLVLTKAHGDCFSLAHTLELHVSSQVQRYIYRLNAQF